MQDLIETIDARGVATLTLNRPVRRNALDGALIAQMSDALRRLDAQPDARIVVLTANGPAFCAGGDIDWMKRMADASLAENEADALALGKLLYALDTLSKPTIAQVHGAAYGGGVGLVACCDIVIAAESAFFCLSEVKLGLVPALVGPFVTRSIGARQARRFVMTAEEISAAEALRIGLVHLVAADGEFPMACDRIIDALLKSAPGAQSEAKSLIARYERCGIDDELMQEASRILARRRASPEGREGLSAFLENRPAAWRASS